MHGYDIVVWAETTSHPLLSHVTFPNLLHIQKHERFGRSADPNLRPGMYHSAWLNLTPEGRGLDITHSLCTWDQWWHFWNVIRSTSVQYGISVSKGFTYPSRQLLQSLFPFPPVFVIFKPGVICEAREAEPRTVGEGILSGD